MHEIGVLKKAVDLVEESAKKNNIDHVLYVKLEVGELSGYLPIFFEKYFPIVTENKSLFTDTELRLEIVKGEGLCLNCENIYNVMKHEGKCPCCGSREKKILGGQDFLVKEIGY